jgi:hypothetical protein
MSITLNKTPLHNAGQNLHYAFTHVDPERVHITVTIDDFDCITEDRKYLFYNRGNQNVSLLPLPARERKLQRNMKVEDFSNQNLVFIPSSSSTDHFVKLSTTILDESAKNLIESQKFVFNTIRRNIQPDLPKVFKYKPDKNDIESVYKNVGTILQTEALKSIKFMGEMFPLIELIKQYHNGLYYPVVALREPLQPHSYTLIKVSVERLKEFLKSKKNWFKTFATFSLIGRLTLSFVPRIYPGVSNHVRIYAPEGLVMRDVEFDLSNKEEKKNQIKILEKELNEEKKDYFDEKCFYIQLGPENSTLMYGCKTHINIKFGFSKKGFHLGLLPLLSFFLWLTIVSPIVFPVLRDPQFILMLLTLSVTILVAIGIYALDKKIVNHYIVTQVVLAFMVFVAEIVFMLIFRFI